MESKNQFLLLAVVLLGALVLSTVAFALNAFLLGYLLIRFQSAWTTYRSYALTGAVLIAAVWLTLLVGASIILSRENKASVAGQFGAITSVSLIAIIGFLGAAVVCSIGLSQSQRTLTSDLTIVRTYFGTILGLTGVALFWVLIGGGIAMQKARKTFVKAIYIQETEKEAERVAKNDLVANEQESKKNLARVQAQAELASKEQQVRDLERQLASAPGDIRTNEMTRGIRMSYGRY